MRFWLVICQAFSRLRSCGVRSHQSARHRMLDAPRAPLKPQTKVTNVNQTEHILLKGQCSVKGISHQTMKLFNQMSYVPTISLQCLSSLICIRLDSVTLKWHKLCCRHTIQTRDCWGTSSFVLQFWWSLSPSRHFWRQPEVITILCMTGCVLWHQGNTILH